ncbi:HTH-type transcriptional repressor BluR [Saezia sanguinis]|uniref:HTH-type transcriptional repressor BluR n=1 Tax=Saezia sanguinis TaxID=1965230 RepID=A0A433SDA0_9BURK|nr:HTH-type transcriptional repressor BluR [Saezia sanguinis]
MTSVLPPIPAKRYFTIGEVSELCGVKPHVLRYWEQEFTQLKPIKRRGNRRYYQHHEVLLIRRIRNLLYEQGFTISGARQQLTGGHASSDKNLNTDSESPAIQKTADEEEIAVSFAELDSQFPSSRQDESDAFNHQNDVPVSMEPQLHKTDTPWPAMDWKVVREELLAIQKILNDE